MKKEYEPSIPNYGTKHHNSPSNSPDPFKSFGKRQKPQISSIPGVSPKKPNRYQIMIGDEVIATELTSEEALAVAKGGKA